MRVGLLPHPAQVQSGIARTGKWWGHQHVVDQEVQPDLMIFAKGIASGFPLAGLAGREPALAPLHLQPDQEAVNVGRVDAPDAPRLAHVPGLHLLGRVQMLSTSAASKSLLDKEMQERA